MIPAEILRMIDEVSPDDTGKLDEIDARVWCYVSDRLFQGMLRPNTRQFHYNLQYPLSMNSPINSDYPRYCTSRDVLKRIRPEGYFIREGGHWRTTGQFFFLLYSATGVAQFYVDALPTEELAELHAIIQAIEHERGGK